MRIVLIVLVFALTLYALLDCARTPEESMPARMPKFLWIILIVLFPTIGPIAWIIVSRVKAAEERGGYVEPTVWSSKEGTSFRRPQRARPMAPDDAARQCPHPPGDVPPARDGAEGGRCQHDQVEDDVLALLAEEGRTQRVLELGDLASGGPHDRHADDDQEDDGGHAGDPLVGGDGGSDRVVRVVGGVGAVGVGGGQGLGGGLLGGHAHDATARPRRTPEGGR